MKRMMRTDPIRSFIAILFGVIAAASALQSCRDIGNDYTYDDMNGVQVRADASSLFLTNRTAETVYYMVVERQTSYLIDWIAGCDVSRSVQSAKTKEIPYSQVTGYKKGCEVVLYWWHCSGTMPARPGGAKTMVFQTP